MKVKHNRFIKNMICALAVSGTIACSATTVYAGNNLSKITYDIETLKIKKEELLNEFAQTEIFKQEYSFKSDDLLFLLEDDIISPREYDYEIERLNSQEFIEQIASSSKSDDKTREELNNLNTQINNLKLQGLVPGSITTLGALGAVGIPLATHLRRKQQTEDACTTK